MPKMILIITLVVMLGLLFGAVSYLLKTPKINIPITSLASETQCEVDSDCKLISVGGCPCNTSDEEFKCFPREEAIEREQQMFNNPERLLCSKCSQPLKIQHTCECANGKCEKVKEELVEEVVIMTDKTEYEHGDMVEIIIKNDLDKELIFRLFIESFDNSDWNRIVKDSRCDCNFQNCPIPQLQIKINSERIKFWDQKKELCGGLPLGQKLRIEMVCGEGSNYVVYSNEFTIKEKSALDARCGEKVKVIVKGLVIAEIGVVSSCEATWLGYEFDKNKKVCVEKNVTGCSFETPFKTLEECQEVCEKAECAGEGEMISIMPDPEAKRYLCCEGLKQGGVFSDDGDGKCYPMMDVAVCINCPNGICGSGENKCNCPDDCE